MMPFLVMGMIGVGAIISWLAWSFNRLVAARNAQREAWSGIDVQLKRRHDLLPVLVTCVQGYRVHEAGLLERIAHARSGAWNAADENVLARDLRQAIAVAEAYPGLKANAHFRDLMTRLVEVEDQLQYARRYYNGCVRDLNNLVQSIPTNWVAKAFGFGAATFFEVESAMVRDAPGVNV